MLERFLSAGSYMNYAHFNGRQYSHKKKQQDVHNDYMYNDQTISLYLYYSLLIQM